jgi:hypothetical protein
MRSVRTVLEMNVKKDKEAKEATDVEISRKLLKRTKVL